MARDGLSIEGAEAEKKIEHIPFPAKVLLLYS